MPSVRSQYGWLGGVVTGTTWEASRTTGWFVRLEADAHLDDPIELLALVTHHGICGERGKPAADREQRGQGGALR